MWLTDFYKRKGLEAFHVVGTKSEVFETVCDSFEIEEIPLVGVEWKGGGGHWMLVVGYQGVVKDGHTQLTHLLCLDPGQESPRASLWNAVIEVFDGSGGSVNQGRFSSNFWDMRGDLIKCQIKDTVSLSLPG
ncbi:hypothetical protein FQZ97_1036190 [compost metagenome]